ncbi:MAG: hypothetical protein E4H14_15620 [Candidatus Thorarchaeota archaeon]|nr:MAG: hypothetical protein E4H14_15620 [Candidatus Thorarchaeota archaeon]
MNTDDKLLEEKGRRFLRRQWKMMVVFGAIAAVAAIEGLLVLTWFVTSAQAVDFIPAVLGQWTIGYVITFILHLIFWELLLVVTWVGVVASAIGYFWYMRLPEEDKIESSGRSKRDGGNAFGFLIGLAWLVVVWLDGRWNLAFESWTFNDWIYSCLAAFGWVLIICGIPMVLFFIWWIKQEPKLEA